MTAYPVPTFTDIQSGILRDIANGLPNAYTGADSDYAVRANGEAAAIEGVYAHQQYIYKQIFPDTADLDNLIRHCSDHGITRKTAYPASGSVTFTGTVMSPVPVSTKVKTAAGIAYMTTAPAVIGADGTVLVTVTAEVAGVAGNQSAGTALVLSSAPTGVVSTATLSVAAKGGADIETPAALLARLLFRLQNPPQGGSNADYQVWATNVAGCGYAYIYGQRFAPNSVDIVILDEQGQLPTTALIASVQAAINAVRPVCASNSLVSGPIAVPVNITGTLTRQTNALLSSVLPLINTSLAAYFAALKPGSTAVYNEIVRLIMDIAGVTDVALTAPVANVPSAISLSSIQMPTLGSVALS